MRRLLVSSLLLLVFATSADAHALHASHAVIRRDGPKRVVIELRLFPDDVEEALARLARRRVSLAEASSDALLARWLQETLLLSDGRRRVALRLDSREFDLKTMWVRIEAKSGGRELRITNRILCDLFADQVNAVSVGDSAPVSFVCTDGERIFRLP